jgi:hypothetical protein
VYKNCYFTYIHLKYINTALPFTACRGIMNDWPITDLEYILVWITFSSNNRLVDWKFHAREAYKLIWIHGGRHLISLYNSLLIYLFPLSVNCLTGWPKSET